MPSAWASSSASTISIAKASRVSVSSGLAGYEDVTETQQIPALASFLEKFARLKV
jgi:hypothetical protein